MLKYNIKLREPQGYDELECNEIYFSSDLSYISGTTDYNYNLFDGQKLMVEFNGTSVFNEVKVNIKNVVRKGFVVYKQLFYVEPFNYGKEYKGFYYVDGKYYFTEKDSNTIEVNGKEYQIEDDKVYVETLYWVEDDKIKIGDITYNVDINLFRKEYKNPDGTKEYKYEVNEPPYIILKGNEKLYVQQCNRNDWEKVTKFVIKKGENFKLDVDYTSFTNKIYYFMPFKGVKNYEKYYFKDGKCKIGDDEYEINNGMAILGDKTYPINYEWVNTSFGRYINLFVNNDNYKFTPQSKILVESSSKLDTRVEANFKNDKEYFSYLGREYYTVTNGKIQFIILNDKKYEFFETKDKWGIEEISEEYEKYGYIYLESDLSPIPVAITKDNKYIVYSYYKLDKTPTKGDIEELDYIVIDGKKIAIHSNIIKDGDKDKETRYVIINKKESFNLIIDDVISNSMIRCHVDIDEENSDSFGVSNNVVNNFRTYNFYLVNELFSENNVSKKGFINEKIHGNILDKLSIFNFSSKIDIPLLMDNEFANNVLQEDIVNNYFTNKEIENSINPIVDMEREIYYPSYRNNDNSFSLINEIIFNLHFRSRNVKDWKINEDYSNEKHSWNIFDCYQYNNSNTDLPSISNNLEIDSLTYQQPADLLYFLNFNDDDIFYQKSKVGKSFLRLSFFNSNNPANQSLLYTCTIFLDEGKLYKKYIDSMSKKNKVFNDYISVNGMKNDNGNIFTSNLVSVGYDTCDKNKNVTFEEDKRLSASFSVKNRYESHESAEGFYLYIFKEYCERLHEEPIYMKIDFNHAGEGRTVNFTIPFKIETDGNGNDVYELLDFSQNSVDIEDFEKGIGLNELYKYVYIPMESVYDFDKKRYCYYMPDWLRMGCEENPSVMKFNLYEIKIKDESIKDSTT